MTLRERLYDAITQCEGLRSDELAVLLECTRTQVNEQALHLLKDGKIRREVDRESLSKKKPYVYFKGTGEPQFSERKKRKITEPTAEGWHARYDELVIHARELEEWKAEAIRRYPDLAVPEIVLRARRIAARTNPDFSDSLLAGKKDESPLMKAVIAALEEAA